MNSSAADRLARIGREHAAILESLNSQAELLHAFVAQITDTFHQRGKLLLLGSGSLGAVASVVANQFLHRLSLERPPLPVFALTQNVTLATALGRDGQGQQFFARQLRALAAAEDVVFAFADFQRDEALEEGLAAARQLGCLVGALRPGREEGFGPPLNFGFHLDTESVPRAIEGALCFGHLLCEMIEGDLFGI